tara:strand:+ start:4203 stop:4415 length:213 start_codon:yes stop_codon:yes gene_type:complete
MKTEDPLVQALLKTLMELENVPERDLKKMIQLAGQLCDQLESPDRIAALMLQMLDCSKEMESDSSITGYV